MSPTILFLLIIVISVFAIGAMKVYGDTPDEWIWATNDYHGTRPVPIYYVDELICNDENATGCYNRNTDEIFIDYHYLGMWLPRGCDVRQHEIAHAWGYNEAQLKQFDCPNPNADYDRRQYNPLNPTHFSPENPIQQDYDIPDERKKSLSYCVMWGIC